VPDKFSGPRLRVRIDIEHVLRPRLSRQQVSANEVLASLPNLKFANATNFKVAPTQAAALDGRQSDAIGHLPGRILNGIQQPLWALDDFLVIKFREQYLVPILLCWHIWSSSFHGHNKAAVWLSFQLEGVRK
jgi:hypothetical protein